MFDIEASKNVGMSSNLVKSDVFRKAVVDHTTSERKGNVAQINRFFRRWSEILYILRNTLLPSILQLITISATKLNLRRSPGNDCI